MGRVIITVAHLVAVSLYAGFQWTVRIVVYPQFAGVGAEEFAAYERAHQRRISYLVGPLFAALVATSALLLVMRPAEFAQGWAVASVALVVAVLLVTGLLAVPLHRTLDRGWDSDAHRSLLRVDALRVAVATANVVLVSVVAVQGA